MSIVKELQAGSTRRLPIQPRLRELLDSAGAAATIDEIRVFSGGQPPYPGKPRVGSTRHDNGWAADLKLVAAGKSLRFSDAKADDRVLAFVEEAAAQGAIGIGAGVDYMGPESLHVGFGVSPDDTRKLVWGAEGHSANAPQWLRAAASAGWERGQLDSHDSKEPTSAEPGPVQAASFVVIARDGLRLRGGPGLEFEKLATIRAGTELTVIEFVGSRQEWAKVDLNSDGLVDGFVYSAFLEKAGDAVDVGSE